MGGPGIAPLPPRLSPLPTKTSDKASPGKAGGSSTRPFVWQLKTNKKIGGEGNPPAAAARLLRAGFAQRKGIRRLRNQTHAGRRRTVPGGHAPPESPRPLRGKRSSFAQPAAARPRLGSRLSSRGFTPGFFSSLPSVPSMSFLRAASAALPRGPRARAGEQGGPAPHPERWSQPFATSGSLWVPESPKPRNSCSWQCSTFRTTSPLPGEKGGQHEVLGHQVEGSEKQGAEEGEGQLDAAEKHLAEAHLDVWKHQDLAERGAPLSTISGLTPRPEAAEPPCRRGPSLTGDAQSPGNLGPLSPTQKPTRKSHSLWEIISPWEITSPLRSV